MCPNYRPKPAEPEGDIRQIALGDGFYAYVDAADYEWLSRWQWSMVGAYAGRYEKGRLVLMHREIVTPRKGMIVDHKNRNKLDNTRGNLRVCTHAENAYNRAKRRGSVSRFKGVGRRKKGNKFYACVYCKGDQFYLGVFANEIDAARAHDARAVEAFGEFAQLNFPEEWPQERRDAVYAQRDAARREAKKRESKNGKTPSRRQKTENRGRKTAKKKKNSRAETQGRGGNRRTRARAATHQPRRNARGEL
jgi:hypothetical protein